MSTNKCGTHCELASFPAAMSVRLQTPEGDDYYFWNAVTDDVSWVAPAAFLEKPLQKSRSAAIVSALSRRHLLFSPNMPRDDVSLKGCCLFCVP